MTPESFDKCVANSGRVRTKTLKDGKYIRICYLDGKSYPGEVKAAKDAKRANQPRS
jgi:hypothetical protein